MRHCLNPTCTAPQNSDPAETCHGCGSGLRLHNRYLAVKPIARGGFGRTFLAVDLSQRSHPRCIIKQFFPQQQEADNLAKASALFRQEAQRLAELGNHPQIPTLLAYLEQDGHQYLIQEFIDGRNLAQELIDEGAFCEDQIWQLLVDLLPVIEFLHTYQVIHRDIKPANIIRDRLTQKLFLVDLGAAKHATGTALAKTGTTIGSAEYTAPEQTRGKALFASDLYSLGATCIHLLTDMSPFDLYDSSEAKWVWQDYLSDPVSNSLAKILNKLLENATNRRYQSVAEVFRDLEVKAQVLPNFHPQLANQNTVEDWDIVAERTAYQLGLNLSFREAKVLIKSSVKSSIARRSHTAFPKKHRPKDFVFPAMLLLLTLPVFVWCVMRSVPPRAPIDPPPSIGSPLQF
jgi:serine/threonine protein kinase